jgi:hypothetical protein
MILCIPVILVATTPSAVAATKYSCRSDKKFDVPMQFSASIESAGRVHLSAFGGADKSGWFVPYTWQLYDDRGRQVDYFPQADLGFASQDMLREVNLEGLVPGASYTIELTSYDYCIHMGSTHNAVGSA